MSEYQFTIERTLGKAEMLFYLTKLLNKKGSITRSDLNQYIKIVLDEISMIEKDKIEYEIDNDMIEALRHIYNSNSIIKG